MNDLPYQLEIYTPGGYGTVLDSFESETPFPRIAVGDLINPGFLNDPGTSPNERLRVVAVEHIPWRGPVRHEYKHKTMLFTEAVPNSPETLFGSRRSEGDIA